MTSFDLVCMGRVGVDLYPQQEGPLRDVTTFAKSLGGSAANVAVAAARLGHRVALVSKVGDDRFGEYVLAALAGFGVDTRWVGRHSTLKTPLVFAELDPPENPGLEFYREPKAPDLELTVDDIDDAAIRDAAILWVTGTGFSQEPSRSATLAAMQARGNRATTVLDLDYRAMFWASPDAAHTALAEALPHASLVVGNREEIAIALGEHGDGAGGGDSTGDDGAGGGRAIGAGLDPQAAAARLLALGVGHAIVKLGADGVLVATPPDISELVAPIRVPVVCGLGAGDAFGGALCHGLLSGWDPVRTARFANAAGAHVAARLACADAMPTEAEVERLMMEHAHA